MNKIECIRKNFKEINSIYLSIGYTNEEEVNSIIRSAFMRIFKKCEFDTMPLANIFGKEFRYICNIDLIELQHQFENAVIRESENIKLPSFEDFKNE